MNTPLSSDEETQRVAALDSYNILDSLPEQEYDDITQLAAQICGTPIALISLVDAQRQWFKANQGLLLQQTPREQSFCAHNVAHPTGPLIVADARLDERFAHNPLVTGQPHMVFYAGVPLVDPQGHTLGSLCVIDQQVRQLTPDQLGALTRLARQVMSLLTLRKTNQALREAKGSIVRQQLDIDFAVQAVGLGVWELDRTTNLVLWDDRCRALFGIAKENPLSYEQAIQCIHPEDVERVDQAVQWAVNPHSDGHYDVTYRTIGADDGQLRWVRFQGKVYFTPAGQVARFGGVAQEVTQQVLDRQQLEESESKLRTILATAPAGIGLFVGRDLVIDKPNQTFIDIVGKGPAIEGLPLREVMPELISEGQPFLQILDDVLTTGEPFFSPGSLVKIVQNGVLQDNYYNISYSPVRNAAGEVYAILDVAIDVTAEVLARQRIQETEVILREAVELAQLGTWSIEVAAQTLVFSDRLIEWFGYDPKAQAYQAVIPILEAADQQRVNQAVAWALNPASDGVYNEIYTVIHPQTGQRRILHARGQTVFDAAGKAIRLNGTAQDITLQRELQFALESQVQQRTEELAVSNEELSATNNDLAARNVEYAALNDELAETNGLLIRSNQNLEQFAYIASHDLQEPLRKIQQFGDLLQAQYSEGLGEGTLYLERMQVAARRMSVLIKDLLTFSRIATTQATAQPVSLSEVINQVVESLSLTIEESKAQIEVAHLPTVPGDAPQLNQLFQNLLSNALKFRRTDAEGTFLAPQVVVRSRMVARGELPASVKPSQEAEAYHLIEVEDNGIGFQEKYLDRIFQVFQRLHGKNEFAGTGVGLAIVQKVVTNHGGAITASGRPNQGATFCIYLPA